MIPVHTQRHFNVHTTSSQRYGRWDDVCVGTGLTFLNRSLKAYIKAMRY